MPSLITSDLEVVAHRGFSDVYPENTLRAFEAAAETADWIELDVHRCRSGEIVSFHDRTLDRLTDATGDVRCTDWETLAHLEVGDSGEGIPRLESVFEAVPDDVGLLIELKQLGLAADVLRTAQRYGNDIGVSSNALLPLVRARAADEGVPVGLQLKGEIYGDVRTSELGMELAGELGFGFVCHGPEYCRDPSFVAFAHERGLAVRSSTPASGLTPDLWDDLESAGVDHVVIDAPPAFLDQ